MADSQKYKPLLHDNPLCGIDTYKDTLNLATGACTRQIKQLVFTGNEQFTNTQIEGGYRAEFKLQDYIKADAKSLSLCSHFPYHANWTVVPGFVPNNASTSLFFQSLYSDFAAYCAQQYANGTPVIVYYVLATPTTETITVPTGLSGTEEGYLTQSGTPTPTNPVYPTANEVLIWQHSLRKLTTATEAVENPLYSDGTAITTYTLKGNEEHTGTPSPQNPVMPNGVGERTAQLLDFNTWANNVYVVRGTKVVSGNSITITSTAATCFTGWNTTEYPAAARIPVTEGETIHLTWDTDADDSSSVWIFPNASATGEVHTAASNKSLDYTVPSGVDYITFRLDVATANKTITYSNIMFNRGSTAKPFEPYGYKIPISNGQQTTNIYLGSTQTTRQIKKLVLTGEETECAYAQGTFYLSDITDYAKLNNVVTCLCSHFIANKNITSISAAQAGVCFYAGSDTSTYRLYLKDSTIQSKSDWQTYLAAQYANGTPVIVWYVLTTPETAAVNEPLMKIGDYADTLSNAQSIPTTEGANSITVDSTVQPSEFTATWTGWHNANVKEWDGSDWQ